MIQASQIVISCEHGGNNIPENCKHIFTNEEDILNTHYGWDPGALSFAEHLKSTLDCPLVFQTISRLVVECNRRLEHPQLWSRFTQDLTEGQKETLLAAIYHPYRDALHQALQAKQETFSRALHLSAHTMAETVGDQVRWMDIAFLFDPKRPFEEELCYAWAEKILEDYPQFRIAFNEPFQGYNDGQVVWLRGMYGQDQYLGIEVELNQKWVNTSTWQLLHEAVSSSLLSILPTMTE